MNDSHLKAQRTNLGGHLKGVQAYPPAVVDVGVVYRSGETHLWGLERVSAQAKIRFGEWMPSTFMRNSKCTYREYPRLI